jgi:hypothetical protein
VQTSVVSYNLKIKVQDEKCIDMDPGGGFGSWLRDWRSGRGCSLDTPDQP